MSKHCALAVSLITMLADMYQDHANEDEENARNSSDQRLKDALKMNASAWEAAACKAREVVEMIEGTASQRAMLAARIGARPRPSRPRPRARGRGTEAVNRDA